MASEQVEAVDSSRFVAKQRVTVRSTTLGEQSLAYYDDGGSGPTIVLVHPNSCSTEAWERQLSETLPDGSPNPLSAYRRVALDLPGHGNTTRLDGGVNAYSLPFYADALGAFAHALRLEGAFYVGHSLGGHAVLEAGGRLPNPAGALIFGSPPVSTHEQLGRAFFPMPGGPHFLTGALSSADVCHWEASVFYDAIPEWFAASVARTDPNARSGLAASLATLADEVGMLKSYPCSLALVHGRYERTVRLSYLESLGVDDALWRGAVQLVDEANHFTQFDAPAAFNALLAAFVAEHA